MRYLVGLSDRAMNMAQPVEQGERSINKMFKGSRMGRERRRWGEEEKEEEGILRRFEGTEVIFSIFFYYDGYYN